MAELYGVDFGERLDCRMCRYNLFQVERGFGKVNDDPVSVVSVRCGRCGTPLYQFQVDWKASPREDDHVVIDDGIIREEGFVR